MLEQPFTNREIDKKFQDQSADIKAHMALLINPLTEQVKYTNGRVRLLEKLLWLGMGGLAVLTFFFTEDRLNLTNKVNDTKAQQALIEEATNNVLFVENENTSK